MYKYRYMYKKKAKKKKLRIFLRGEWDKGSGEDGECWQRRLFYSRDDGAVTTTIT